MLKAPKIHKNTKAFRPISRFIWVLGDPGDPWESEDLHEPLLVHRVRASDPLGSSLTHAISMFLCSDWIEEKSKVCRFWLHCIAPFRRIILQIPGLLRGRLICIKPSFLVFSFSAPQSVFVVTRCDLTLHIFSKTLIKQLSEVHVSWLSGKSRSMSVATC